MQGLRQQFGNWREIAGAVLFLALSALFLLGTPKFVEVFEDEPPSNSTVAVLDGSGSKLEGGSLQSDLSKHPFPGIDANLQDYEIHSTLDASRSCPLGVSRTRPRFYSKECAGVAAEIAAYQASAQPSLPSCAKRGLRTELQGKWVQRASAPPLPPCCSWDRDSRINNATCLPLVDPFNMQGDLCGFLPIGGHGCNCSIERQRAIAAYEWQPQNCRLPPWSAKHFCCALDKRRLLFVGDSTQQQMFGALANLLVEADAFCAEQVLFRHGDTLIAENLGAMNRGPAWYVSAKEVQADIVVISAYYHVASQEGFERVLREVDAAYQREFPATESRPLVVWTTSLGAVSGDAPLDRLPSQIPGIWEAERAKRNTYNHEQIESWDNMALDFWANRPDSLHGLDLRATWLRADAKVGPADAVHFCMPGPFEMIARYLLALLLLEYPAGAHVVEQPKS
jgi:hypothetical protein